MKNLYYWIESKCAASDFELLSWQLFEAGAPTIEETKESSDETKVFRINVETPEVLEALKPLLEPYGYTTGEEESRDWDKFWRDQQTPIEVTSGLRVLPPWVKDPTPEGVVDLIIEPKMAFGTGSHESTQLTAELMENVISQSKRMLDIGTGTGILSLYAKILNPQVQQTTTEIDPLTTPCIIENYQQNEQEQPLILLSDLDALQSEGYYDLILANMIRSEIWPLRADMVRLLQKNGFLIISGQLADEKHYILDWFESEDIQVHQDIQKKEWWAVCGQKRS